jgi:hypothetical protein
MTLNSDSLIKRNEEIISSEIDHETVMMDLNFENYFGLEAIGTRIWLLLENETSINTLCEKLTEEFDVEMDQCMKDVLPFLSDLSKNGMILEK